MNSFNNIDGLFCKANESKVSNDDKSFSNKSKNFINEINKMEVPIMNFQGISPLIIDFNDGGIRWGNGGIFKIKDNILSIYINITKRLRQIPNIDFKFDLKKATWKCFYNIPSDTFYASISIRRENSVNIEVSQTNFNHLIIVNITKMENDLGNHSVFFKLFRNLIIGKPFEIERNEHLWFNIVDVAPIHIDEKCSIKTEYDLLNDYEWSELINTTKFTTNFSYNHDPIEYLLEENTWNKYMNIYWNPCCLCEDSPIHLKSYWYFSFNDSIKCVTDCLVKIEENDDPRSCLIWISILSILMSITKFRKEIFDKHFHYTLKLLKSLVSPKDYDWNNVSRKCVKIIIELTKSGSFLLNLQNRTLPWSIKGY